MITIRREKTAYSEKTVTEDEAKEITEKYLKEYVIGESCSIDGDGNLSHWMS